MSRSAHAKGKRRFHAKFAHARFIVIPYQTCNRYDLGMQIINICHGMSCPNWQWHRTGYRWSPVRRQFGAPPPFHTVGRQFQHSRLCCPPPPVGTLSHYHTSGVWPFIELAVGRQFEHYRWRPCGVTWILWTLFPISLGNKAGRGAARRGSESHTHDSERRRGSKSHTRLGSASRIRVTHLPTTRIGVADPSHTHTHGSCLARR